LHARYAEGNGSPENGGKDGETCTKHGENTEYARRESNEFSQRPYYPTTYGKMKDWLVQNPVQFAQMRCRTLILLKSPWHGQVCLQRSKQALLR